MKIVLIKSKNMAIKGISLIMAITMISTFISIPFIEARADIKSQPSFEVKIDSATPNPALIGEDIEINGTITPKDFQEGIKSQKKELVLVLDVSGSMNKNPTKKTTKIEELKKAANNFLTKMSTVSDLKIGIVVYTSEATINPTLARHKYTDNNGNSYNYDIKQTSSVSEKDYSYIPDYKSAVNGFLDANNKNIETLKGMVNGLEALGGTNTGEGLRKAEYMLEQGDKEANKSIVFMSDGQPTFYSVEEKHEKHYDDYKSIDNTNPSYYGTGNSDEDGKCKKYAETIGKIIKENKNDVFSIGYGLDSYGNKTMQDIHNSMGGQEKNFFPTDVGAIDEVFNSIADKIINSYTIDSLTMNMNFNSDDGFSLSSEGNTIKLNNIIYTRESKADANGYWTYKAEPIKFKFIIMGSKIGEYKNVFKNSITKFLWQNGTISEQKIEDELVIKIIDNSIPVIRANIVTQEPNPAMQSDNVSITCEVKPEIFEFNKIITNATEQKQVPSYTFKTKLKFNLGGKFDSISGLNSCSDKGYDVETPEFDVIYNLKDGQYIAEPVDLKSFTVKIKNTNLPINNLSFGPGVISYVDLAKKLTNNPIALYPLNLKCPISILKHGLYEGIKNKEPSILQNVDRNNQPFNLAKGSSVNLGATMFGSINNNTDLRLEIPKELEISNAINVYVCDDSNGQLTPIGIMKKASPNDSNIIYKYNGQEAVDKKILILYNEKLPESPKIHEYTNSLYASYGSKKDIKIKITEESPDLF